MSMTAHTPNKKISLSVIIPAYNEESSIAQTLDTVAGVAPTKEIIVVNDASSDKTKQILADFEAKLGSENKFKFLRRFQIINKVKNQGKGAAIRSALPFVTGDVVLIQDADLELDPHEYPKLLEPFEKLGADIVFGSRFRREGIMRVHNTIHFLGNKILTWVSNIFTGFYITDMETCYKVFRREVIQSFKLKSNRFGIEPELTARAARAVKEGKLEFYEVPVSYRPRTYAEGKKIGLKDGFVALGAIVYFNLFKNA